MELQGLQGVLLRGNTKKNNAKAQKTKLSVGGGELLTIKGITLGLFNRGQCSQVRTFKIAF